MYSDTKLTVKGATDANTPANRRLGDLNPMEDAPDQDSAKDPATKMLKRDFACSSNPGYIVSLWTCHN